MKLDQSQRQKRASHYHWEMTVAQSLETLSEAWLTHNNGQHTAVILGKEWHTIQAAVLYREMDKITAYYPANWINKRGAFLRIGMRVNR